MNLSTNDVSRLRHQRKTSARLSDEQRKAVDYQTAMEKFLVIRAGLLPLNPEECWLWPGALTAKGYGCIRLSDDYRDRYFTVHRMSYKVQPVHGKLFPNEVLLHECDNRRCWNPWHLWPGTQRDNMRDMVAKGRHWKQRAFRGEE